MMIHIKSLFWKLFLGTTVLIVVVLSLSAWLIVAKVERFYAADLSQHLKSRTIVIRDTLYNQINSQNDAELDHFIKKLAASCNDGIRITIIQSDGVVMADSEGDPAHMESHDNRKEVQQALSQGWGEETRYSKTLSCETKYVAVRVGPADNPWGVVRAAMAIRTIGQRTEAIQHVIWTIVLLGLAAAIMFAMGLARVWSRPIQQITTMARSLAQGDLSARFYTTTRDEIAVLGQAINEMRNHLASQLETLDYQHRTLESLLAQLHEGVLVVGPDGRILLINPFALHLLGCDPKTCQQPDKLIGVPVEQCVQHHTLLQLILDKKRAEARDNDQVEEARIQIENATGERFLLARASDISLPNINAQGPLSETNNDSTVLHVRMLILTDVTELTRTERVKSAFASNASHELRTPLSAIRAAVETLMTMDMAADSKSATHFLSVIDRHSYRMQQMVSDLLDLSRLESAPKQFMPQRLNLPELIKNLRHRYLDRVEAKKLQWTINVSPEVTTVEANPHLLDIVLDNLIDNAIKFTNPTGKITLTCRWLQKTESSEPAVVLAVSDTGCGIPQEEQGRVFERFYQVQKARSGPERGTGLGLSIVRHAVTAMHGTLQLWSRPSEGTCLTITIPQPGATQRTLPNDNI